MVGKYYEKQSTKQRIYALTLYFAKEVIPGQTETLIIKHRAKLN